MTESIWWIKVEAASGLDADGSTKPLNSSLMAASARIVGG
jgi:hypothetical protein